MVRVARPATRSDNLNASLIPPAPSVRSDGKHRSAVELMGFRPTFSIPQKLLLAIARQYGWCYIMRHAWRWFLSKRVALLLLLSAAQCAIAQSKAPDSYDVLPYSTILSSGPLASTVASITSYNGAPCALAASATVPTCGSNAGNSLTS